MESRELSEQIKVLMCSKGVTLATAESCTAGLVAATIGAVPGASQYFMGGAVCYSNEAKHEILGVDASTLDRFGAVSEATVTEMVRGACRIYHATYAVATSGIAGPTGGTPDKPVGTIWMAVGNADRVVTKMVSGDCGREQNVARTVQEVLKLLLKTVQEAEN